MGSLLICEKCGETIKKDEERTHKIFCYSWLDADKNQ
jgi:formylmethanofuran dehydrogenase subunit E